jgi:hypothetical protein
MALLLEEAPFLQNTGKMELQPQRIPFLNHIAFTLRTYAETIGLEPDFFGLNGWNQLRTALAVRHRLTHPKSLNDIEVSDADLKAVKEGNEWLRGVLGRLYKGMRGFSRSRWWFPYPQSFRSDSNELSRGHREKSNEAGRIRASKKNAQSRCFSYGWSVRTEKLPSCSMTW